VEYVPQKIQPVGTYGRVPSSFRHMASSDGVLSALAGSGWGVSNFLRDWLHPRSMPRASQGSEGKKMGEIKVEDCPRLSALTFAAHLASWDYAPQDGPEYTEDEAICRNARRDESVTVRLRCFRTEAVLRYRWRNSVSREETESQCLVGVELARGGRAYLRCPGYNCGRRVRHLYFLEGLFLCRHCHNLAYQSQAKRRIPMRQLRREWVRLAVAETLMDVALGNPCQAEQQDNAATAQPLEKPPSGERRRTPQKRRGRPRQKRAYRSDGSRRVSLKPGEAYCCRCRAPRAYRYARRAELMLDYDSDLDRVPRRIAIRARCRECNTPVFRMARAQEAQGLQEVHVGNKRYSEGLIEAEAERRAREKLLSLLIREFSPEHPWLRPWL